MISQDLSQAVELLHAGECVAMPTETVYGLAADASRVDAVAKIFSIKNRPTFDPLIVHIPEQGDVFRVASDFPKIAKKLAEKFWPGPLTLILPKRSEIPDLVSSGLPTVGIRVPRHPIAQQLLRQFGRPLAAPSANRFGRISPTTAQAVEKELGEEVPLILEGGNSEIGLESTIVGFHEGRPTILRLGGISVEEIESVIGPVGLDNHPHARPQAPGQIAQHYAPRKPLKLAENMEEFEKGRDPAVGALIWGNISEEGFKVAYNLSPQCDWSEAATRFFQMLRALDESDAPRLMAIRLPEEGLARAINERLQRAAHL
jgi:L-threonylcarbamoyladenylate synthase